MGARNGGIAAFTVAFRGVLVDLDAAEEALVYEIARRHGQPPMDRGRALARRLRALATELGGVAPAVDALAAERGFRWSPSGADAVARLAPGAGRARACGRCSSASRRPSSRSPTAEHALVDSALRPLDGAFTAVVCARGARGALRAALARADAPADRVVHVGRDPAELRAAARARDARRPGRGAVAPRPRHPARRGAMTPGAPAGVGHGGAGARVARPHPEQRDPAGDAVARARARPPLRRRPPDGARGPPAARPSGSAAASAEP